jgi:hypothetical protein
LGGPTVLEVGVGSANFLVAAIDNQDDRMVYAGPAYSYYEFQRPAEGRLNDQEWALLLAKGEAPARPEWTKTFQAKREERNLGPKKPSSGRE